MSKFYLTRRKLVLALLTGAALGRSTNYWRAFANDQEPLDIQFPPDPDFANPSLELFVVLSKLITLRVSLDQAMADRMYPLFMAEPWGPHHISSTYQQLLGLVSTSPDKTLDLSTRENLGKGQAWFADHILTTWYLGIYYHESRPSQRVGYEQCLMFDAIHGKLPIPYLESTGFGTWASAPNVDS